LRLLQKYLLGLQEIGASGGSAVGKTKKSHAGERGFYGVLQDPWLMKAGLQIQHSRKTYAAHGLEAKQAGSSGEHG
jgi:hypothetical protein